MGKRVFFLNPPSYEGFDGGAGSRYQAKREVRSFWYPTWLAQSAALCPGSRLLDAPVEEFSVEETVKAAAGFDVLVIFTSTPGFRNDAKLLERFKAEYPGILTAMVGPHVTALPEETLRSCSALDFVARNEFDYTIRDIARGMPPSEVEGVSYRRDGRIIHITPRSAGWTYVGFDVYRLAAGASAVLFSAGDSHALARTLSATLSDPAGRAAVVARAADPPPRPRGQGAKTATAGRWPATRAAPPCARAAGSTTRRPRAAWATAGICPPP